MRILVQAPKASRPATRRDPQRRAVSRREKLHRATCRQDTPTGQPPAKASCRPFARSVKGARATATFENSARRPLQAASRYRPTSPNHLRRRQQISFAILRPFVELRFENSFRRFAKLFRPVIQTAQLNGYDFLHRAGKTRIRRCASRHLALPEPQRCAPSHQQRRQRQPDKQKCRRKRIGIPLSVFSTLPHHQDQKLPLAMSITGNGPLQIRLNKPI